MRKVNLIFATDGIFPESIGGMQRHSRLLIEALSKYDISIKVIHPHHKKIFDKFENIDEFKVTPIDESKNYLRECKRYSKSVAEIIDQFPDHIIYSQGLSVWYNAYKYKKRLIVNPHGLEPYQAIGFKDQLIALPFKRVFNHLFKKAGYVISLGGKLTDILASRIPLQKIHEIPNATNYPLKKETKKEYPNSKYRFFFLSRFASNKGINILFDVIKNLNEKGLEDQVEFILDGKGPLWEYYNSNNNFSNVMLLGFVDDSDLPQLFVDADCFILPTLFEGMPTVILEAMSYQLPIISTDVGAVAELVNESNGYLCKPNNEKDIEEAIISFINLDSLEKERLGNNSFRKFESTFTWGKVAEKHISLFKQVIEDNKQ